MSSICTCPSSPGLMENAIASVPATMYACVRRRLVMNSGSDGTLERSFWTSVWRVWARCCSSCVAAEDCFWFVAPVSLISWDMTYWRC